MKPKISFLLLILMSAAIISIAQTNEKSKISFALLGGINFQSLNEKISSDEKMDYQLIIGYHIGMNVEIPIAPEFVFQPGLLFTTKGAKSTNGALTTTVNLSYIELPLNLAYRGLLGKGYLMIGLGPYFAYAIGGKVLTEGGGGSTSNKIEFKNKVEVTDPLSVTYFKPLDIGGNIFAGYEMANGVFGQLNTQLGMVNINPEDNRVGGNTSTIKNVGFGLSFGYRF